MVQTHSRIFILEYHLSEIRGLCTSDQLVGDWELRFIGEQGQFNKLDFKIKNQILPGNERYYDPIC